MSETEQLRYPPIKPIPYTLSMGIGRFLVRTLTRFHVEGAENVPEQGAVIMTPNHLHYLDVPIGGIVLPRYTWAFAASKYKDHWLFRPALTYGAGAIWVRRGEGDADAMNTALNVLKDDHCLAISPEGTRSSTGTLQGAKTGAALMGSRTGATFVPIAVWGTENIISAWKKLRRADVYVVFGQPFTFPKGEVSREVLQERTIEIMCRIAAMLPEKYRGIYTDHPLTLEKLAELEKGADG